jgi:hypothetical protein
MARLAELSKAKKKNSDSEELSAPKNEGIVESTKEEEDDDLVDKTKKKSKRMHGMPHLY